MEAKFDIRKTARNAAIVLVMAGLIAYVVYHCLQYFKEPVQVTAAVRQTERDTVEMTAYLFRDEQVLTSSWGGVVQTLAEDGSHVSIDSEVARVYLNGQGETLQAQLCEIDERIAFYEACLDGASLSYTDLPALDHAISRAYRDVMAAQTEGDGAQTQQLSDELLLLLNRRQVLTGELTDLSAKLDALRTERAAVEAAYIGTYESISVDKSGYFYRTTDGYETIFSNDALKGMTLEGFYSLIEQSPVATSNHVGKLIGDYIWYAAIPTTVWEVQRLIEGDVYPVTFSDGTRLEMELDSILSDPAEEDERCVLILKTGNMPQGFDYSRVQQVTLEVGQTSGLRVPQNALLIGKDGEAGVYILDIAYVRYRRVEVIFRGDGYVLAREYDRTEEGYEDALGYQEMIITRTDEELYDGKLLY